MILSVIIPVYNKAPYLERCFDSLIDKEAQIIIVDDGSTDGSAEVCDEYGDEYGWEVYHIKHGGVSVARNLGLSKAKGQYVTFLDADDCYTEDAIEVMNKIARHGFNIYQFNHFRHHETGTVSDYIVKGHKDLNHIPRRWPMVWNKMYKRSFLVKHRIQFKKGVQFGEDELFSARCILANGGLYQAPQTLIEHYFDDKKSLCRGELSLARLENLLKEMESLAKKQKDPVKAEWLRHKISVHEHSALYRQFGYKKTNDGKYDVVYVVKNAMYDEELRYSLRSLEENWQYRDVWFYGGKPKGLNPDHHVKINQNQPRKWENVRAMLREACNNPDLSDDFWLFNDDFFVLKPQSENMPAFYTGELKDRIAKVKKKHGGEHTEWTRNLEHLIGTLEGAGKGTLDYALHLPMKYNKKKLAEVLDLFPDEPMVRALYGNYWQVGGVVKGDVKIAIQNSSKIQEIATKWSFVSTSDESFESGNIGVWIRSRFDKPSRFEV